MNRNIAEELRIKAGMIEAGEKIAFGSDAELMRESAAKIDELIACLNCSTGLLFRLDKYKLINAIDEEDEAMADHYSDLCAHIIKENKKVLNIGQ